jgi:hypothetical protein
MKGIGEMKRTYIQSLRLRNPSDKNARVFFAASKNILPQISRNLNYYHQYIISKDMYLMNYSVQ